MSERKPPALPSFPEKTIALAFRYYAAGSSTHAVAAQLSLSMDDADELLRLYVDTNRSRFAPDRIAKRQAMRNKLGTAASFLESVYLGQHAAISGKEGDRAVEPARLKDLRALLGIQVTAAKAMIAAGRAFVSESLLDILVERAQEEAESAQATLFELTIVPGEKGGSSLVHMPNEDDDELRTGT